MRRISLGLVSLLLVIGASGALRAEEDGEVRMSLARFERLMAAAQRTDGPRPTWSKGSVSVVLPGDGADVVEVDVSAELRLVGDGVAEVVLLPAEFVVESASIGGSNATLLVRDGAYVTLVEPGTRRTSISLRYLVPVRSDRSGARVAVLGLPPLPGAELTVEASGGTGPIEVWPGTVTDESGGTLTAALPPGVAAVVRWGHDAAAQRIRRVDYALAVNEGIDAADVTGKIEVALQAPSAEIPVADSGVALMEVRDGRGTLPTRVLGERHVARVEGKGRHELVVRFRVPVDRSQGQPQATLSLDGAPITRVAAEVPGQRDVVFEPTVPLELTRTGEGDRARTLAVGFLPPLPSVTVRWTEPRPSEELQVRINSETYQLVTLQEGVMRSKVTLRYNVLRGKTKELGIRIPDDVVLYKVSGEGIEDWRTFAPADDHPRQVRVFLGRELEGDYALELELETVIPKTEGAALQIPVVRPLEVFRESGVIALFDGDKVGFAPAQQTRYTKVGEDALPVDLRQTLTERVSQAFKHIGEPGPIATSVATAKAREIRFDAQVKTLYHVKEGALVGYAALLIELKSGRQDVVQLSLPTGVNVLEVTAPSLNKHEPAEIEGLGEGRKGHEIRFTRALEGAIQIDMEFELLLEKELGTVVLPDVRVLGAEVEEGSFGITADPGIEVQPGTATDVRQVAVNELAKAIRLRSPREVLLGYRYARAPWSLDVQVKRHRTVETLKAVVTAAWLDTAVLEDGHIVTRAVYQVRNDDRQYLRVAMPARHKVWSVMVAGEKVKAVADDTGALAVPLTKEDTVLVEVVYELGFEKVNFIGSVDLVAPKADLVTTDVKWRVRIPEDYSVNDVDTELKETETWAFQGTGADGALPVDAQALDEMKVYVFARAVHDPSEEPLAVSFSLVVQPDEAFAWALLFLAALLFLPFVRRTARRKGQCGLTWSLLGLGVIALVAKSFIWELEPVDGVVVAAVVIVVAIVSWLQARREAPSDETS